MYQVSSLSRSASCILEHHTCCITDMACTGPGCAAPLCLSRYPLADSDTEEYLPVATTRPETILGDTAVAVNPADERFKAYVGRRVTVPMSGGRTIPVIADDYVDMEFGTGALKITPGGFRGFEIVRRTPFPPWRCRESRHTRFQDMFV